MLFFNILLIIYCVYTAALSSGAQFRTAVLNAPAATHQIGVSVFLLFFRLGRQEVCSITTSDQNGKVEDEEACPRSPKESEVHAEIQPGHLTRPSSRPRQPPGRSKTLGTRITSSQLHGPGAAAASKVHARLGLGANSTNMAASAAVCCFLGWEEADWGAVEDHCAISTSCGLRQGRPAWQVKGNVPVGLTALGSQVTGMNADSFSLLPKPQRRKTLSRKEANAVPPST